MMMTHWRIRFLLAVKVNGNFILLVWVPNSFKLNQDTEIRLQ